MTFIPPPLFIGDKQQTANDPSRIPVAFKQLERYIGGLRIPTGGGGGGYVSLTGPGQTTTPGDLTQKGGFTVISTGSTGITLDTGGTAGGFITLESNNSIELTDNSTINPGILIGESGSAVIQIMANGGGDIELHGNAGGNVGLFVGGGGNIMMHNLPIANPGVTNALWNNGGVINIV